MVEFEVVMDKLHGFETADELADYFRYCGIQAVPGMGKRCAISKFVTQETGKSVSTTSKFVEYYERDKGFVSTRFARDNSPPMTEFVRRFDRGYYPDLIEEGFFVDGET